MATKPANDRLITVHAPFLAIAPNQNATLQFVLCTIDPQCYDDCCRLCGFGFFWRRNENEILFCELLILGFSLFILLLILSCALEHFMEFAHYKCY